ncbi:elongator complex protein 6-like [Osmia bicornis bicornis]|uniref:elongator complex protein 6-like n=1 Tax=Osmia bicornis bicornis TaxID=1437191 RepID=UPI0010F7E91B|nr:elongator complex protein 6-like [Osmia bicornis bicornis]XP_029044477.1 elongator complex protein 6-like [Osmia bicornis bicornis]
MCSIMDSVADTLGIDKVNMDGKVILIEEQHYSNANFLSSAIISDALKKDYRICFVLFHNTFNHYHNVGMKFGYNLSLLKEKGKVTFIEPIKINAPDMETINKVIDNLFITIKNEYNEMKKDNKPVIIIIDDLSHLYNFGLNLKQCMYYIRCLRSLIEHDKTAQLCVMTHTYKHEGSDTFVDILKYMAHLFVMVEPLKTGYSNDATGIMTINWRVDPIRRKHNWPEVAKYVYKLSDRQVQIFASGI